MKTQKQIEEKIAELRENALPPVDLFRDDKPREWAMIAALEWVLNA